MQKTTRWSPDTCSCVIEYTWDSEVPEQDRVHTHSQSVKTCGAHTPRHEKKAHLDTVLEENQRKNKAHAAVYEILKEKNPNLTVEEFTKDFSFSFDQNRNLKISHKDLKAQDKAKLKSDIDTLVGQNKVSID